MSDADITPELKRFIGEHINSVEQLEVLLLLERDRSRAWTAVEVSQQLASNPLSVETRLLDLSARGLVVATESGGVLQYRRTAAHDADVAALARAYAGRRTSVITLIFSKPIDSVRTLADAFRFRDRKATDAERRKGTDPDRKDGA